MLQISAITPPMVIAHRGFRARFPENTLAAFRAAAGVAHMIELDVTFSRDRQLVVIHDDTLERTSNGHGAVRDQPLTALKRLDAGSWFATRFANEPIPTLEEVLDLTPRPPYINVEIKYTPEASSEWHAALAEAVIDLLRHRGALATVLVSSFAPEILRRIARMSAAPALALLAQEPLDARQFDLLTEIGAWSYNPDHTLLDAGQIARVRALGLRVLPYTVNSAARITRLVAMGCAGIFTDDPLLVPLSGGSRQDGV